MTDLSGKIVLHGKTISKIKTVHLRKISGINFVDNRSLIYKELSKVEKQKHKNHVEK